VVFDFEGKERFFGIQRLERLDDACRGVRRSFSSQKTVYDVDRNVVFVFERKERFLSGGKTKSLNAVFFGENDQKKIALNLPKN
jgi:hypothetical protein